MGLFGEKSCGVGLIFLDWLVPQSGQASHWQHLQDSLVS